MTDHHRWQEGREKTKVLSISLFSLVLCRPPPLFFLQQKEIRWCGGMNACEEGYMYISPLQHHGKRRRSLNKTSASPQPGIRRLNPPAHLSRYDFAEIVLLFVILWPGNNENGAQDKKKIGNKNKRWVQQQQQPGLKCDTSCNIGSWWSSFPSLSVLPVTLPLTVLLYNIVWLYRSCATCFIGPSRDLLITTVFVRHPTPIKTMTEPISFFFSWRFSSRRGGTFEKSLSPFRCTQSDPKNKTKKEWISYCFLCASRQWRRKRSLRFLGNGAHARDRLRCNQSIQPGEFRVTLHVGIYAGGLFRNANLEKKGFPFSISMYVYLFIEMLAPTPVSTGLIEWNIPYLPPTVLRRCRSISCYDAQTFIRHV